MTLETRFRMLLPCAVVVALVAATAHAELALPEGSDVTVGDIIAPGFHVNAAAGASSEDPGKLAVGGHDPNRDGFTLQGLELNAAVHATENLQAFAAYTFFWGTDEEEWGDEWEEYFVLLTGLPGGLEIRSGRLLNRFGLYNSTHQHAWSMVDQNLANARILGEEGLATVGGDVTWYLPTSFFSAIALSYGEAPSHHHEESEKHGDDEDEGEEEHHEDAEELGFENDFFSATVYVQLDQENDRQLSAVGSLAMGDNGFGEETVIAALGLGRKWLHDGRPTHWQTELILRDYRADAGDSGSEFGVVTELIHDLNDRTKVGLRGGYVEGIDELELEERIRVSPVATFFLSEERNALLRLQYNYDDLEDSGSAHSGWLQFQYSFGLHGSELAHGRGDHTGCASCVGHAGHDH